MAAPTYTVEVGWGNALAGTFIIGTSRLTDADGLLPEGGAGDVLSSSFTQFFDGPQDDITAYVTTNGGECEVAWATLQAA